MNHPPRQDHTEWKELHTRTIVNGIPTEDIHLTSELKNGVTELSGTVNGKKVFITRPHQPISQLLFPKKSVRFMEDEASFPSEILPIERTPTQKHLKRKVANVEENHAEVAEKPEENQAEAAEKPKEIANQTQNKKPFNYLFIRNIEYPYIFICNIYYIWTDVKLCVIYSKLKWNCIV